MENQWREAVVEDRHAGPAEVVRVRLDFASWLRNLQRRNRRIAQFLALGNSTGDTARKFKMSAGRISQLRRQLKEAWQRFAGEAMDDDLVAA